MTATTPNAPDLGSQVGMHRAAGGFTGFQNRAAGRALFLSIAGAAVGLIPGLFIALIADLWPAMIVTALIGAIAGFVWARRGFDAAVTEARLHERGVVLVDARGTHAVAWGDIVSMEAKVIQNVGSTPLGDFKGAVNHSYALRTRDGMGFWLDDRIENVAALAEAVARSSSVTVTRMG